MSEQTRQGCPAPGRHLLGPAEAPPALTPWQSWGSAGTRLDVPEVGAASAHKGKSRQGGVIGTSASRKGENRAFPFLSPTKTTSTKGGIAFGEAKCIRSASPSISAGLGRLKTLRILQLCCCRTFCKGRTWPRGGEAGSTVTRLAKLNKAGESYSSSLEEYKQSRDASIARLYVYTSRAKGTV